MPCSVSKKRYPRINVCRFLVRIALAGLLVGAVVGCEPSNTEVDTSPPPVVPTVTVPVGVPVAITFAGRFDEPTLSVLDRQIIAFEAAHPDIKVELAQAARTSAERHDEYTTYLAGRDDSVDLLAADLPWLAEFASAGWLAPLDSYVERAGVRLSEFLEASVQASRINGQTVALPWFADGGMMYYRRDLLDKYREVPPGSWEDLARIAREIGEREGLAYGFVWQGAAYEGLTCSALEFVWAYGGDVLDASGRVAFASPETQTALQQMLKLVDSGVSPRDVTEFHDNEALAAFRNGDAVVMRNWAYAWNRVNQVGSPVAGRVAIAPLPAACLGGQALTVSSASQHKEQAFHLIAFLTGYDQQVQMALDAGRPPTLEAAYQDAQLLAADPAWASLYAALTAARPRPQLALYAKVSELLYTEVHRMLGGEESPEATARRIQEQLEIILKQP